MPPPTLIVQTTYAELLERCAASAFSDAFPESGTFISKTVKGRRYWYFQLPTAKERMQRYVGPETPELLERIERHREARSDESERRSLVSALVRFGMPRPESNIGRVIDALARAGIFRVRSVLVGTIAYQTYSAMLGEKLPSTLLQTGDIDIALFASTSKAIEDRMVPVLDVLQTTGQKFRGVPKPVTGRPPTSYQTQRGDLRVDFLTPNEGADTDEPTFLPALQTYAQPLRFLDFLIREAEAAVLLHDAGVYVTVPAPERYALHKLIVAQRRSSGKRQKDIHQADALLKVLVEKRQGELKTVWDEAVGRGGKWKQLLLDGLGQLSQHARDMTLRVLKLTRSVVPGLDLTFRNPTPHYIFDRHVVVFRGEANGEDVQCEISLEALQDHFGADGLTQKECVQRFLQNRSAIEAMARAKYLTQPVEQPGSVLLKTADIPELRKKARPRMATRRAP
jgi:hypothetical protein